MRPRVREDSSSPPQSPLLLPLEASQPPVSSATPSALALRTGGGGGGGRGLSSMVVRPSENSRFDESDIDDGDARPASRRDKSRSPFRGRRSVSPGFRRRLSRSPFPHRESPSLEFRRPRGFKDNAGSLSPPTRRRLDDGRYDPDYDYPRRPSFGRGARGGRGTGRFRDVSPHYGPRRGRGYGRGYTVPKRLSPFEGDYVHRNDPNLSPREGDWICQNPSCGNLNFARRTHCNNCNEYRFGPDGREFSRSPRRGYINSPSRFQSPPSFPGLPQHANRPLRRDASFRSPPHGWTVDGSRDFRFGSPDLRRRGGRLPDGIRREKVDYDDEREHKDRHKCNWSRRGEWVSRPGEWVSRPEQRDDVVSTRGGMGNHSPSPPNGHWFRHDREKNRSRSPVARERSFTYVGRHQDDRPKRYSGPFTGRGQLSNSNTGRRRAYRHNNGTVIGRPGDHRRDNRENIY